MTIMADPFGLAGSAISPTAVETDLGGRTWAEGTGEPSEQLNPTRRFARPRETAHAMPDPVSGAPGMVNGADFARDGGFSAT